VARLLSRATVRVPLLVGATWLVGTVIGSSCVVTDEEHLDGKGGAGNGSASGGAGGQVPTGGEGGSGGALTGGSGGGSGGSGGGSGGSGAGTGGPSGVACDGAVCSPPEVCCVYQGVYACMTTGACENQSGPFLMDELFIMSCDDFEDCEAGEACCVRQQDWYVYYECSSAKCSLHESCAESAECSDPSDVCVDAPGTGSGYKCVPGGASVACKGGACSGATPVCCMDDGSCVAYGDACTLAYECDGPGDCGGDDCCVSASGSTCSGTCLPSNVACDTVADCPLDGGNSATDCSTTDIVKTCQYQP
jgi:hypothetical protein